MNESLILNLLQPTVITKNGVSPTKNPMMRYDVQALTDYCNFISLSISYLHFNNFFKCR